jgi:ketosteroid isomerase-like protein
MDRAGAGRGGRRVAGALGLALLLAAPALARGVDPEAAVLAAVAELDALLVRKDAAGLARLLVEDFVGVVPTGAWFRRDDYIAYHCRPGEGLASVELAPGTSPVVRVVEGRFAVVNRRAAVRRKAADGREQAFAVQRIEVLALRDGRWRLVSGQGTPVGALPPR